MFRCRPVDSLVIKILGTAIHVNAHEYLEGNIVKNYRKVQHRTATERSYKRPLHGRLFKVLLDSYDPQTDSTDCYWHITAPAGRRIQLRLSTPPSNCMEGCPWQSIEINLGQFDLHGMIMCCQSAVGQTYTSVSNLVAIRGAIRYNQLTFGLDYRII
ncbi:hypothetical protein Aduo_016351 [Ancylostoma duodenale]